ncbi:hypothetical protein GCM10011583_50790 [Streptomyces camponoticapitis]|uniref:DUF3344 domain-containing protein n=1 Tax=Streptomyces camponoticapitis TaxID=1616125 RepID=A0ABQ2EL63_9ACTN|nr:DUF3344 domain-containing protein [Streptomyces camponoticapitis]GGK12576.1 hypothetical protein GCM10011583_50790 [Streptomyces camponoticapitis]
MRGCAVHAVRRGLLFAVTATATAVAVTPAPVSSASAAPAAPKVSKDSADAPAEEAARIPFARRYHAVQHGGIVRAANSAITCRTTGRFTPVTPAAASACEGARDSATAANERYDMFYTDLDDDPNTYNSTRSELRVPAGAKVSYARLYWGGNLRVGEQKPPQDNGRVLIAEPGGAYKEVLSDTLIGHRTADGADAYQASADITPLVRSAGSGVYTVAQINVAMGRTAAGAWGGWTMVVAYERAEDPLRHLALWDGFEALDAEHPRVRVGLGKLPTPAGGAGAIGVVSYDGDSGRGGDSLTVGTGRGKARSIGDSANPADDVMNSSIADGGINQIKRQPAYKNTLGYDSDIFDLREALVPGGDTMNVSYRTGRDSVRLGAFFVAADARR